MPRKKKSYEEHLQTRREYERGYRERNREKLREYNTNFVRQKRLREKE